MWNSTVVGERSNASRTNASRTTRTKAYAWPCSRRLSWRFCRRPNDDSHWGRGFGPIPSTSNAMSLTQFKLVAWSSFMGINYLESELDHFCRGKRVKPRCSKGFICALATKQLAHLLHTLDRLDHDLQNVFRGRHTWSARNRSCLPGRICMMRLWHTCLSGGMYCLW